MPLAVVLISPRNPLNIGAAARAMSNFGFFDLRLVQPYDVAWQEARSAVGAARVLQETRVFDTVADAIADCSLVAGTASLGHRDLTHTVKRLEQGALQIRRRIASGQAAILFGSEKYGLSNDDLSYCHFLMRIPTRREHESMNLGQAVAVCLWELIRGSAKPPAAKEKKSALSADLSRIEEITLELLRDSGYLQPPVDTASVLKLRRLIRRMSFQSQDSQVFLGMLRQIRWRIHDLKAKAPAADK